MNVNIHQHPSFSHRSSCHIHSPIIHIPFIYHFTVGLSQFYPSTRWYWRAGAWRHGRESMRLSRLRILTSSFDGDARIWSAFNGQCPLDHDFWIWGFPARKMGVSPIARWRVYFHGKIPIEKMGDDVWGTPMTSRKPPSYGMVDG